MARYRAIPSLSIWYDMEFQSISGKPEYGWSREQIEQRRQGEKLRTVPELTDLETGLLDRRDSTWDGQIAMTRNAGASVVPRSISKANEVHMWALVYRHFDNFLFSPEGRARQQETTRNIMVAESDYWLPAALQRNRADFALAEKSEVISGQNCRVLTRGRFDQFWIAPELGYAVCQRDILIGNEIDIRGGVLSGVQFDKRERTMASEFKKIDDHWFPHKIVREIFVAGQKPDEWVLRDRRTLTVKLISTSKIDDEEFRLPIPEGVTIFDITK